MAWKTNRKLVEAGFADLKYVPRERCGWDATLACLAYAARMDLAGRMPDLAAWAARHAVPASRRYCELGESALALWHGTGRERAERIAEHGLFHKKGLWTAAHPGIPHAFCRGRSEQFGTEGAVVCIVLDRRELVDGRDCEVEGNGSVVRFHHGLGPEVVEYVLVREGIRFTDRERARDPAPWPGARFRKRAGKWAPAQKAPVRYSDSAAFSSAKEFAALCIERLMEEFGEATALEMFSSVYAAIDPRDALEHRKLLKIIEDRCVPGRRRGKGGTYRARTERE